MDNEDKSTLYKYRLDILFMVTVILVAFIISKNYSILYVKGDSMYPTYTDRDTLILNKEKETSNGSIVVFNSPESWSENSRKFIKRIIASEGDILQVNNEQMIVNGKVVSEISDKKCGLEEDYKIEVEVEKGKYFVVGDNHSASNDSLTQLCNDNEVFFVDESEVILSGKQTMVIGGFSIE